MSRIGRLPIDIPAGVEVTIAENNVVTVKGPKGTLTESLPVEMDIKMENNQVIVTRPSDLKKMKSLHGLTRTLIANMVTVLQKVMRKFWRSTVLVTEHRNRVKSLSSPSDILIR